VGTGEWSKPTFSNIGEEIIFTFVEVMGKF